MNDRGAEVVPGGVDPKALPDLTQRAYSAHRMARLSPADSPLTLVARPEGDGVAVGVRYHPLPWRDRVSETYGDYDDIGIGRSVAQTIAEEHGGSLSEEATDTETTSWLRLPVGTGAHA